MIHSVAAPEGLQTRAGSRVEIARTQEQVRAMRAQLDELRASDPIMTPNADPDRFLATASALGEQPYVAMFIDESGAAHGAIMGRTSRRKTGGRLGYVNAPSPTVQCLDVVYGGLIGGRHAGGRAQLASHLLELMRSGEVSCVTVNHLDAQDEAAAPLRAWGRICEEPSTCWSTPLGESPLARFSSKHRNTLKRKERKLGEGAGGAIDMRVFSSEQDIEAFTPATAELARSTWQRHAGAGFDDTPVWRGILKAEAAGGRLRCYWLTCDGKPIAFQIGMVYAGRYYLETLGYDPRFGALSPGILLLVRSFVDLGSRGVKDFDFGFGDAEYKRTYGVEQRSEVSLRLYGPGVMPGTAYLVDAASRRLSRGAERLLAEGGARSRVKKWYKGVIGKRAGGKDGVKDSAKDADKE